MNFVQKLGTAIKSAFSADGGQSFFTWVNENFVNRSRKSLLKEYKNAVYSCVTAIAEDVARYQPIVYRRMPDGNNKPLMNHELLSLLANPSPMLTQFDLFEATQSYIELTGEAFWYLPFGATTKKPKEIIIVRPDKMEVVVKKGLILGYTYKPENGDPDIPLEVNEIIHFKKFNPLNPYRGLGTVQANMLYIDTENATSEFQNHFLRNQASPSGVLAIKGGITKEAFKKLKQKWKETHGGTNNAGKTLFIREAEASFQKIGLALNDLNLKDLSDINGMKVRQAFRVPKVLLGETDSTGLGRANVEAIEYVFEKHNIDPKLIRLDGMLNLMLKRYWGDSGLYVDHVSQIPTDDVALLNEQDKGVDRWLTRNEIRAQRGLPSIDGGDKLYVPFNMVPSDETATTQDNTGKAVQHTCNCAQCQHERSVKGDIKKERQLPLFNILDKLEEKTGDNYNKGLTKLLKQQQKDVMEKVGPLIDTKSVTYDGSAFTLTFSTEAVELNLLKWLLDAFLGSGKSTLEELGEPDLDFVMTQGQRNAVAESTERLLKSFNEETALKLQQQISQGLVAGESKAEITARIESVYEEATGHRARRIADTEAHKAINAANVEVYKTLGYKKVEWVAESNACPFCKQFDGKVQEIGTSFLPKGATVTDQDGNEFLNDYTDVDYADLHPYCRCRLIPIK